MDAIHWTGLGLALLVAGGDMLVRGAVALARSLGVPPMIIGLTLVGFGTSTPELLTSMEAALRDAPGIAVGNVVGSNIANILLILGVAAVLRPIPVSRAALFRDGTVVTAATALCLVPIVLGSVGRGWGLLFVGLLGAYLWFTILRERRQASAAGAVYTAEADLLTPSRSRLWREGVMALAGLALTLVGARLLVDGAVSMASALGVSDAVIGLTIVAVGTSLPELVTSIMAARKGEGDVALGNVIGSNLFNIMGILGVTALVSPLPVPGQIAGLDGWIMLGVTLLMVAFCYTGRRLGRREGATLLLLYAAYVASLAYLAA